MSRIGRSSIYLKRNPRRHLWPTYGRQIPFLQSTKVRILLANNEERLASFVQRCDKCQRFAKTTHQPPEELSSFVAPWPFAQWGLDILGPFPLAKAQKKFLIVACEYFTKWVEAEAVAAITQKNVENFYGKTLSADSVFLSRSSSTMGHN